VGHVAVSVPHEELQHPFAVQSLTALHFFHDVVETWRVGGLRLFELYHPDGTLLSLMFGDCHFQVDFTAVTPARWPSIGTAWTCIRTGHAPSTNKKGRRFGLAIWVGHVRNTVVTLGEPTYRELQCPWWPANTPFWVDQSFKNAQL
jgi:hypothetical protein